MSDRFDAAKSWIAQNYRDIRIWYRKYAPTVFNGVSRIHYYEARERFFFLIDLIRLQGLLYGLSFPFSENIRVQNYSTHVDSMRDQINNMPVTTPDEEKLKDKSYALLTCYEAIVSSIIYLTRKQGDLNRLWRTMARVHSRLVRIIVTSDLQSEHLYFCHEEAFRLGLDNDQNIKAMLQELAESIDSKKVPSPKYQCVLCALIERFNTIRTDRIHQQFLNVKTYGKAFFMLMIVSVVLIVNHDLIMNEFNNPQFSKGAENGSRINENAGEPKKDLNELKAKPISLKLTATNENVREEDKSNVIDEEKDATDTKYNTGNLFYRIYGGINNLLKNNMFFFVFFGGLTGGAFSLATRARRVDREHGEDVYTSVYVLTKPFIGALGAIILYILMHTSFLTQNLIKENMISYLRMPGAVSFGFAFIAGFSERLIFPQFR